ncbi:DUF389 domain-containing protein [Sandaracinobacter sp. RS1-74]|uniref:DUF389 domain-containing protein n=1 Tax=Sandaracinobacteroides sayramensis TaxID=2913411 RepID=UPI001EDB4C45|nr:DUF389 domain-containing protein [Sandaracinobacteroides sayramensis]MCG2840064.1 DUF389 domain-containing protein [Sandaracinobacteroides sayramensis]
MVEVERVETSASAGGHEERQSRAVRKVKVWHRRSMVDSVEHAAVLKRVHDEAPWSGRYAFMITMSAAIAILGMLLSSPAIVIGAMLISPLMAPIVGLGFALATFDWPEVRKSLLALVGGTALAILFTALIVLLSPLQDMTSEILSRTRPNLFDLLVAVFSALAGGYATIKGRGETIVGVALATSLMPPLAAVGYGLAAANMAVAGGAFALFLTNFIAITLCVALMARLYGFGSALSPRQTQGQAVALVLLFVVLAVPLAISLKQIAWEAWASRAIRNSITAEFGGNSRIVALEPVFTGSKLVVRATVLTDRVHGKATEDLERRLSKSLKRPVQMQLSQVLANQGSGRAELERARAADTDVGVDRLVRADMAARLSLVSGVPVDEVLVDSVARVATAQVQDGRSLVELMQAEARLATDSPGWTISLLPPPGALPPFALSDSILEDELQAQAIAWALGRRGTDSARVSARRLTGESAAAANARTALVAQLLEAQGVIVEQAPALPVDRELERDRGREAVRAVQIEALPPAPKSEEPEETSAVKSGKARVGQA